MDRIIAFDVETPNSYNDRMSAIGIAVIQNGQIFRTWSTLVNPETHFDPFNIQLTGISPEMVKDAPTFPQLWDRIGRFMQSGLLLNTLCEALNIPLDHHKADSDSRACAELLLNYLDHGLNLDHYRRVFDMRAMCTVKTVR